MLEIGIVGLPNVGKSSLFNALTRANAAASNFPFTTIEPNVGVVAVPDERLEFLANHFQSAKIVPATIKFVDIAGLIGGAHKGEGLGNKFLSHIRSVDAIVEVVRVFDDPNVTHVRGGIDPKNDIATINTELLLADLEQARQSLEKLKKSKDPYWLEPIKNLEKAVRLLNDGKSLRSDLRLASAVGEFQFLSAKPLIYLVNISEGPSEITSIKNYVQAEGAAVVAINVKAELEIVELPESEQAEYRQELGLTSGLDEVIASGYQLLGLITFFTAGPKEAHAWPIQRGTDAPSAAGQIHTDFQRGFIRAQVYSVNDLRELKSEKAIKEHGKMRSEGKDYIVQDGDVIEFMFNV